MPPKCLQIEDVENATQTLSITTELILAPLLKMRPLTKAYRAPSEWQKFKILFFSVKINLELWAFTQAKKNLQV